MFLYHFFDYKYNIPSFDSDLFSAPHIIYIILAIISAILVIIFRKKIKTDHFNLIFKILSIIIIALEISKMSFESYYDITTGRGFNKEGLLPIYTCSLYIYCMFLQAFFKGKLREYSLSFLTTIGMLAGLIGMIYCNGLNWYPFWTFGAFYSLFFHYAMFITGVIMLATRYVELDKRDIIKAWVPILIISFIALPVNSEYGADYMQIYEGSGVPLMSNLAKVLAAHKLRWLFSLIMIASYLILSSFVVGVYYLSTHLTNKKMQKAIN